MKRHLYILLFIVIILYLGFAGFLVDNVNTSRKNTLQNIPTKEANYQHIS